MDTANCEHATFSKHGATTYRNTKAEVRSPRCCNV